MTVFHIHILDLTGKDEDGLWDYEIVHPSSCKKEEVKLGGGGLFILQYGCDVDAHIQAAGLEAFSDPLPEVPGKYLIESWFEVHNSIEHGIDYDSGLRFCRGGSQCRLVR